MEREEPKSALFVISRFFLSFLYVCTRFFDCHSPLSFSFSPARALSSMCKIKGNSGVSVYLCVVSLCCLFSFLSLFSSLHSLLLSLSRLLATSSLSLSLSVSLSHSLSLAPTFFDMQNWLTAIV